MNILALLQQRFTPALSAAAADVQPLLAMIRPAQDPKFGDYQANFAMSLGKQLGGKPARDVASQIAAATPLDDFCNPPEIAGPGFINLKLRDDWLETQLNAAAHDDRLGIAPTIQPRTFVIDYSSPNVAKPMHVGHIRSTVIGDALYRTLQFLGHRVISDNHLGDWGTQFGMIIYGYKHFADEAAFKANPVPELSRLYRLVSKLVEYREAQAAIPQLTSVLAKKQAEIEELSLQKPSDKAAEKKHRQHLQKLQEAEGGIGAEIWKNENKVKAINEDPVLSKLADAHPTIGDAVLAETAKLHEGDAENLKLWHEFLPNCRDEIQRVYKRLDVKFDHELGESFYHERLAPVVEDFQKRGLAQDSQGAVCVFLDGFETPMIIRKKDGAFLYSTTDLATIAYRRETWNPDVILYVVDHRQSEHFEKLFAAAVKWAANQMQLVHVKFGTVLGEDGRPYKTRSGDTVGLEGLLDEAVSRALAIVQENSPELSPDEQRRVSETVGIGGLKYADLAHDRESDYKFSYEKMLQLNGATATYLQYFYARCRSIFRKAETTPAAVLASGARITLGQPEERALAIQLLRFAEALAVVEADFRPHQLTAYLFDLAKTYAGFYERCPVLKAESIVQIRSRLLLCDLTARTIATGLRLLGIGVEEKM